MSVGRRLAAWRSNRMRHCVVYHSVWRRYGILVSVGIAPTKTLAKVANRLAKKDTAAGGVRLLLDDQAQREALGRLELTDLWGIAGRLAERLRAIGITTPLELRDADSRLIRERFSVVLERMVELRGVACLGLEEVTPDRKSLIASRSSGRTVRAPSSSRVRFGTDSTRDSASGPDVDVTRPLSGIVRDDEPDRVCGPPRS